MGGGSGGSEKGGRGMDEQITPRGRIAPSPSYSLLSYLFRLGLAGPSLPTRVGGKELGIPLAPSLIRGFSRSPPSSRFFPAACRPTLEFRVGSRFREARGVVGGAGGSPERIGETVPPPFLLVQNSRARPKPSAGDEGEGCTVSNHGGLDPPVLG